MQTLSHLKLAVQTLNLGRTQSEKLPNRSWTWGLRYPLTSVPNEGEIDHTIEAILAKVPSKKVWINPDCGLKTRGIPETKESLIRLVDAAKAAREKL